MVYIRDIFTGLDFLNRKGLFYGGIKGNSFARNHLWLEIILYNLQIIIFFIGSHLCRYQISLAMRAMPGRSAQGTFQTILRNSIVLSGLEIKRPKITKKKLSSSVCVFHKAAKQVILSHFVARKKTAVNDQK